jgi:adenine-specific DNA-methyltransferase
MPRKKAKPASVSAQPVSDYRHDDARRKNNPPAGLAAHGKVRSAPKLRYAYDPHLPPALRFDASGRSERLDALIGRAIGGTLSEEDGAILRDLLGSGAPWLEWAGKREANDFVVDPVALHIHERISTQAILRTLQRDDVQRDLFADPQQEYRDAVRFYEHDVDWSNRMILGDSLQVMASLAHREDLAGKVQMIYMDPPYGIRFASNFQPEIGKRDVKDKDQDLTREPETVKAYRDTWTLGVHSYLSYLRDRLVLARELLTDSGSIFVQISDENLHRLRCLMDEVFGVENFQAAIAFRTSVPLKSTGLASIADYAVWYARDRDQMKRFDIFELRDAGEGGIYTSIQEESGHRRAMSKAERREPRRARAHGRVFGTDNLVSSGFTPTCIYTIPFEGQDYDPTSGKSWKTNESGMRRLIAASRLNASGSTLRAMMYIDDYPVKKLTNLWTDTKGETDKLFVVQTAAKIIQRCMLMTTDPGDLVFDPTCGSGTTAYVAEQWGRRWITIDTSRVALALARQRLMTATFPHYAVKDDDASDGRANPSRGFNDRTVPHITLKSIAQNVALDPLFRKHQKILDALLVALNAALQYVTPELRAKLKRKLAEKQKAEGKRAITDADRRRWLLPVQEWKEWEVPFDTDEGWPEALRDALVAWRNAWRAKMDEVNELIAAGAEQEELVDDPEVERGVVRVAGPFTMEAVMPIAQSDGAEAGFGGEPEDELDTFDATDAVNAEAFVDRMLRLLAADGVRFPDNRTLKFRRLDRMEAGTALHGEGEWGNGDAESRRVVVSIGPEHGPVTAYQVEEGLREAHRRGADDVVFAGFSFDGAAQAAIQDDAHPRVRAHLAHIAPDVQMGGLLKTTPDSQLFSVFGLPRAELRQDGDEWTVEMQGVDIYDPVQNTIHATRADKVAAWFLDTDYDGRTFCIAQAFFPDRSAWKKLERALRGTIDPDRFDDLTGTTSLPFRPGVHKRVAVKVIDPRGNEVMRVLRVKT